MDIAGGDYREFVQMLKNEPGEGGLWEAILSKTNKAETSRQAKDSWYCEEADRLLLQNDPSVNKASRTRFVEEIMLFPGNGPNISMGDYRPDRDGDNCRQTVDRVIKRTGPKVGLA
jgi:hypothetical protein